MEVRIDPSWKEHLKSEFDKPYFATLTSFVRNEYSIKKVYPPPAQIFNAFDNCPWTKLKVVILGQDPYHGPNQANGLSFSVNPEIQKPPSLMNIFKEVQADTGEIPLPNGDLTPWAEQGVLLLNATLTVVAATAASHQGKGWEAFTDAVIKKVSDEKAHVVFILWGNYARKKRSLIDGTKHLILESAHPSPLSAHNGFFGNHHFTRANEYLKEHRQTPIKWGS
ncbi:MAG: uracil-DNA glycosylase [bacterium]|nr:uracil-DNA glycosylase [bacterium]